MAPAAARRHVRGPVRRGRLAGDTAGAARGAIIVARHSDCFDGPVVMTNRRRTAGFTLVELLIVVAIIAILSAIAMPQFSRYRQKGFDARLEHDVRNAATAQESYFIANSTYAATCTLPGFSVSAINGCAMAAGNTGNITTSFKVTITNTNGTASYTNGCTWESAPPVGGPNMTCS